ncbi:MAG: hypothetical protein HQK51_17670 [Oligoflexia bacterium]|nr:hypothetical protein [Oligoflexia bacterium]
MDMKDKTATAIGKLIKEMPTGAVITPDSFPESWSRNAITRTLSRLQKQGVILRLQNGVYSKSKETRLGPASSSPIEIISIKIEQSEDKCFGGLFLYNKLGLTTQIPSVIEILNNKSSYNTKFGNTQIRYVRIRPKITSQTKKVIIILEVIKNIKLILDIEIKTTLHWITKAIKAFDKNEKKLLFNVSADYPPRVCAILGNILSSIDIPLSNKLMKGLNQNSVYRVGSVADHLKDSKKWKLLTSGPKQ